MTDEDRSEYLGRLSLTEIIKKCQEMNNLEERNAQSRGKI